MTNRLAVLALFASALPALAQPTGPLPPNPAHSRPADPALNPVPTDGFLFVSVKASKLWDNPAAKPFRDWVASQKEGSTERLIGLAPGEVDRVTFFLPSIGDRGEPGALLLVTTRKPYNEARLLKALAVGEPGELRGRRTKGRVFEIDGPMRWVALLDDRTLLFMGDDRDSGPTLVAQLIARKPDGPLAAALAEAQLHDVTVGIDAAQFANVFRAESPEFDKELAPFLVLLKAKTATLTADFDKTARGKLTLTFPDAATAKRAAPVLEEGMKTVIELVNDKGGRPDPFRKIAITWGVTVLKNAKVAADGANVIATADVPYSDELGKAVAALPKSLAQTRGNVQAMNNLKQLALGMHNMHDSYGQFPGDVGFWAGQKNPPLSWRVSMLPFIEQENIYRKLDPSKPWDDDTNLKILEAAAMPKVFEHPGRPAPKNHTYFRIFSYPKNAKGNDRPFFEEGQRGPKLTSITDGTSNTLMIVEAGEAVPWYKADVLAYDGKLPLPQLGDKEADVFLAAFGDGSVRSFRRSKLDEATLRALITRSGGEPVSVPDR